MVSAGDVLERAAIWARVWTPLALGYIAFSTAAVLATTDETDDGLVRWVAVASGVAGLCVFAPGGSLVSTAGEMFQRGVVVVALAITSLNISAEMASGSKYPAGQWMLLACGAGLALLALVLRKHDADGRAKCAAEARLVASVVTELERSGREHQSGKGFDDQSVAPREGSSMQQWRLLASLCVLAFLLGRRSRRL